MKILFCNYEYPPLGGGGGVVMAAIARLLAQRHEVVVLTSRAFDLAPLENDAGVTVLRVPVLMRQELATATMPSMLSYVPSALWQAARLPQLREFDVINTHFVVPTGPVGQWLARQHDVPNILSLHGGDLYDPSKRMSPHRHAWLRAPIRGMLRKADVLVAQSRNTASHLPNLYGVDRKVEIIPLGIERPPAAARDRARFKLPDDAVVVVTVGRLVARKSVLQLAHAMARAGNEKVHLLVVGSGPDEQPLRDMARSLGVEARLHMLGQATDEEKYAALAAADVFASSSQHEGFGLVFLEAMAFGLPIVCYDEGGQVDFLVNGETGFVVKLNDLDTFSRSLSILADSQARRRELGEHNRRKVEDYFVDTCARRHEALFAAAIETRQEARRARRAL